MERSKARQVTGASRYERTPHSGAGDINHEREDAEVARPALEPTDHRRLRRRSAARNCEFELPKFRVGPLEKVVGFAGHSSLPMPRAAVPFDDASFA